jgi:hypothetical protein
LVLTPTPTSVILPEAWDDPILNLAIARGWKVLGDQEKAGFWRQEGELLASRAKKFTERSSQEPRRFKSSIAGAFGGRL